MRFFRRGSRDPDSVLMQEVDERHNLSQQVFFRREERGWTQTELAARCGTTQAQIANIEAGNVNPTLHTLVRLAHIFGCLAHDLLRPLDEDGAWERPSARDWATWGAGGAARRKVTVIRVDASYEAATYREPGNDALALNA